MVSLELGVYRVSYLLFDHLRQLLLLAEILREALHTCTERIIRAHEDLLALYAQADQLKASSVIDLRCFAYSLTISLEVAFYFVTIIASLLSYRCSLLKHHRLSSAFDLNRCLSLLAAHSVLGLWKPT